jgi:uncharacterized lipoprotein YajG
LYNKNIGHKSLEKKMKKTSNNYLYLLISILLLFTSGCVSTGPSTLKLRYEPLANTQKPSSTVSNIKLIKFQDVRNRKSEPEKIGHREAAFGVSMGDVFIERPLSDIIHNAFKSELINNGYSIVNTGEDFTITGKILNFWVGTDVSTTYWDVYGEVRIEVEVKNANGDTTKVGPYYAKNVERTYTNPSVPIMERVILASLNEVIVKILSDKKFAQ